MARRLRGWRSLVVDGQRWRYRATADWCRDGQAECALASVDGSGYVVLRRPREGGALRATVSAGVFPELPAPPPFAEYLVPLEDFGDWLPGVLGDALRWCLRPQSARPLVHDPPRPWWRSTPLVLEPAPVAPERWELLAQALGRPVDERFLARGARDAARTAVLLRSCWERLEAQGALPAELREGNARAFLAAREEEPAALREEPLPASPLQLLRVSHDPAATLAAEELARELRARLGEALPLPPWEPRWCVARDLFAGTDAHLEEPAQDALDALEVALCALLGEPAPAPATEPFADPVEALRARSRGHAEAAQRWERVRALGRPLPRTTRLREELCEAGLGAAENPFEPLFALEARGFALARVGLPGEALVGAPVLLPAALRG